MLHFMTYEFIYEFMYMKNIVKSYLKSCVPRFQMFVGGSRGRSQSVKPEALFACATSDSEIMIAKS